jgi:hypothetical protein
MGLIAASSGYVDWSSMWKILVISILAGAGLASVFSVGLVALSASGYMRGSSDGASVPHRVLPLVVCVLCGLIVVAAAVYGIHVIFTK